MNKTHCGISFELEVSLTRKQRNVIDKAAKRNNMVAVVVPENSNRFIVVFANRVDRDNFVTQITPKIYGEIEYNYINSINLGDY